MRTKLISIGVLTVALAACGGGGTTASGGVGGAGGGSAGGSVFKKDPVQLTADPCTLVTKAEAEAAVGAPIHLDETPMADDEMRCDYKTEIAIGGHVFVNLQTPDWCKLLFLALDKDIFGGVQVRVDDIGQGGMLVKGLGNVQFVVNGGCVSIDVAKTSDQAADDDTVLAMARLAATRLATSKAER
jgi:hypothetical protein